MFYFVLFLLKIFFFTSCCQGLHESQDHYCHSDTQTCLLTCMHRHTHNIKPAEWLPTARKPHGICKWDEREVWVHGSHANVMETSKTEVINRLAACSCLNEHHVALKATHMTHSRANMHISEHMKGRFGVHTSECSKRHGT